MICRVCKQDKPDTAFQWAKKGRYRFRECSPCRWVRVKVWLVKTGRAEKNKAYQRAKHRAARDSVLDHYGRQCACCGETEQEFLEMDHMANDGGAHRRVMRGRTIYTWLIKQGFPVGFQTLCSNCNKAKGRLGKCPHELR